MNNYESRELLNMPMPKHFDKMTDEELANYLTRSRNYNILIPMLIEANRRKDTVITSKSIDRKYERYCRELGFIKNRLRLFNSPAPQS